MIGFSGLCISCTQCLGMWASILLARMSTMNLLVSITFRYLQLKSIFNNTDFDVKVSEAIFVVTSAIKDVCGKPPTESLFLDKYGRICLCLDEIVWKVPSFFFIYFWITYYFGYCKLYLKFFIIICYQGVVGEHGQR